MAESARTHAATPLTRRSFLVGAGALGAALALGPTIPRALAGNGRRYDDGTSDVPAGIDGEVQRVIIIGAGWAGLAAANALTNAGVDNVVVEAKDRIGGRAHTADVGGTPIDLGCSWIHEPVGNPLSRLARQAGVATTSGDIELDIATIRFFDRATGEVPPHEALPVYRHFVEFDEALADLSERLGPDASMRDGITLYLDDRGVPGDERRRDEYFLRLLTEQPDSLDWDEISLRSWAEYEDKYIGVGQGNMPRGGYRRLIDAIAHDLDIRTSHEVTAIDWDETGVRVSTVVDGEPTELTGSHVVVTSSLGVLKSGAISFVPGLPADKQAAIARMGFGAFEKVAMRFDAPFWESDAKTHILHSSSPTPMQLPIFIDLHRLSGEPALVAFCTAAAARAQIANGTEAALDSVLEALDVMMGRTVPRPTAVRQTSWLNDPHVRGSYSAVSVDQLDSDFDALAAPVAGRVLFAGEATNRERYGYADGAFSTGIREAKRLLGSPDVTITAKPDLLSNV